MKTMKRTAIFVLFLGLSLGACRDRDSSRLAADNSGRNARDRDGNSLTAGDQPENEADRTLTQRVRQAIVADDSLSTNGKNVKIITANGMVTLRGPVSSEQERQQIIRKAEQVAGPGKVRSELEVAKS